MSLDIKMKKILPIILIIVTIPIYTYDLFLLFRMFIQTENAGDLVKEENSFSIGKLLLHAAPVKFEEKGRSPFVPNTIAVKPAIPVESKPSPAVSLKEASKPPSIVITGIMWNHSSPVAMLTLPDGSSAVAKVGQSFGGIVVKKIEKNRILVNSEGKEFWIER